MTGPDAVTVLWGPVASGERRAAHTTLLRAAAELTGSPLHRIGLAHEPGGRPRLTGPAARLHVSVSHSPGARAVALAGTPVGVDIETVRPLPALALARRWLAPADADWLGRLPAADRVPAFYWLWTQKEAVGKAHGHGLAHGGLTQPLPHPPHWPPPSAADRTPALSALPGGTGAACTVLPTGAGPYGSHVLAVAGLGAPGAPVDLRHCDA
ncbi:4'-phosphopantetheinyl transferase family protein [Streptomyces sp. NPDC058548]|uniref:4'-phosphopantetheinyl transferase family protein n=1 Tax=unclassified Streptomyces TaxID=2593676 RepID=UPI0036531D12